MKDKTTILLNVLLFGAIWGILEATLGYALHLLPALVSGGVMFPIGSLLMYWAYKNTKSRTAIFFVAMIAAAIKAINFFMPGLPMIKTLNPMVCIMIESVVVFAASYAIDHKSIYVKAGGLVASSFAWRSLFLVNQAINKAVTGSNPSQIASVTNAVKFVFLNGVAEIGVIAVLFLAYYLIGKKFKLEFKPNWIVTASVTAISIIFVTLQIVIGF